jgi:hypothetical protein
MGFVDRMQYLLSSGIAFLAGNLKMYRLELTEEGEGHVLVTSPDLPGFSFLLRPDEHKDFLTVGGAVWPALERYIAAEDEAQAARKNAARFYPHPVEFGGITRDRSGKLFARFCYT